MSEVSEKDRLKIGMWLTHGETGASSKAIAVAAITGYCSDNPSFPWDSYDFNRCVQLITYVPGCKKPAFDILGKKSKIWLNFIEQWDEISRLLNDEWRELSNATDRQWTPKTNAKIKEITKAW